MLPSMSRPYSPRHSSPKRLAMWTALALLFKLRDVYAATGFLSSIRLESSASSALEIVTPAALDPPAVSFPAVSCAMDPLGIAAQVCGLVKGYDRNYTHSRLVNSDGSYDILSQIRNM